MDINNLTTESNTSTSMPVARAVAQQQQAQPPPVSTSTNDKTSSPKKVSPEQAAQYVQEIQTRFDKMGTNLQFSIDKSSADIVVKITDKDSGELIRQFPSEAILQLRQKLDDLVGMLFNEKA